MQGFVENNKRFFLQSGESQKLTCILQCVTPNVNFQLKITKGNQVQDQKVVLNM